MTAENLAARAVRRHFALLAERDWDAFVATIAPTFGMDDRRRGIQSKRDRTAMIEWVRAGIDTGVDDVQIEVLETCGEMAVLGRVTATAVASEFVSESLVMFRTDAEGRLAECVQVDADQMDVARAELDRMTEQEST